MAVTLRVNLARESPGGGQSLGFISGSQPHSLCGYVDFRATAGKRTVVKAAQRPYEVLRTLWL